MSWQPRHDPHRPAPFAPPTVDPYRTRKPRCRHCDQEIVYVTMDPSGKLMPCDSAMVNGDGRRSLVVRYPKGRSIVGRVIAKAGEDVVGLEPHFGTCPVRERARAIEKARTKSDPRDRVLAMVEVPE